MASWRSNLTVAVVAALTIVAADLALQRVMPVPPTLLEVEDGVAALESGDPEILLIGSSHARSFVPIRDRLAAASGGRRQMALVSLEFGKLTGYAWVLDHRLRPLIEETRADGSLVRPSLRRLILVTEWWDGCATGQGLALNIPARAFTLWHLLADVAQSGLNGWNKNWASWRWGRLWRGSVLVQDRGVHRLRHALRAALFGESPEELKAEFDAQVAYWRAMTEEGATDPLCRDPGEQAALEHIVDWGLGRGLDVTLLLFPRMPVTLTEKAKATTIAIWRARVEALARDRGVRLVDMSTSSPLTDADFMSDFDHVTAEGNEKLADWALEGDLHFLLDAPGPPPVAARGDR